MTYLNILALLGAGGFLFASFSLYFSRPLLRIAFGFACLLLALLGAAHLGQNGPEFLQLLGFSTFAYLFLAWNRNREAGAIHGALAAGVLAWMMSSALELITLGLSWLLLMAVCAFMLFRNTFTGVSAPLETPNFRSLGGAKKVLLLGGIVFTLALPFHLISGYGSAFSSLIVKTRAASSPAQKFAPLTVHDPHLLGDVGSGTVMSQTELGYWSLAWRNLKDQPKNFFQKWRANTNRMIFDFPYTHSTGHPAAKGTGNAAFPTAMLFIITCLIIYPWIKSLRLIPVEISLLFIWTIMGLGIRSIFSAGASAILPWVPGLILGIAVILKYSLQIKIQTNRIETHQL